MEAKINSWARMDYFALWPYGLQDSGYSCVGVWLGSGNQSLAAHLATSGRPSSPVILLPSLTFPKFEFALQDLLSQSTRPLFELPVYLGKLSQLQSCKWRVASQWLKESEVLWQKLRNLPSAFTRS